MRASSDMSPGAVRRNGNGHVLCPHNVRLYRCVPCGGAGICEHNRHRYYCVPCGGGGICEHDRRRYRCPKCKRGATPDNGDVTGISRRVAASIMMSMHNRKQSLELNGSDIEQLDDEDTIPELRRDRTSHILCPHNVRLYRCVPCGGTGICEHNRRRYYCVPCGGGGICEHSRRRDKCPQCKEARIPIMEKPAQSESSPPLSNSLAPLEQQTAAVPLSLMAPGMQIPSTPGHRRSRAVNFEVSASAANRPPQAFPLINLSALQQLAVPMNINPMQMTDTSHIEAMLKNWSQSLLVHSSAGGVASASGSGRKKKRGPYNKLVERALPKSETEQQTQEPALEHGEPFPPASKKSITEGLVVVHSKGCNCKHSHCLKRYCECHAAGLLCTTRCKCFACQNGKPPGAEPEEPIAESASQPPVFDQKFIIEGHAVVHSKGCNCKHSHCLKRYCECHAAGARCTARCRCHFCQNGASSVSEPIDVSRFAVTVPPTVLSGCHCKHSGCLKRYCECQAAGARCTSKCRCLACQNGRPQSP